VRAYAVVPRPERDRHESAQSLAIELPSVGHHSDFVNIRSEEMNEQKNHKEVVQLIRLTLKTLMRKFELTLLPVESIPIAVRDKSCKYAFLAAWK
jgi:hypothetical protein